MIEIITTHDGSLGLYNKTLNEVYHSRYGAITEAMEKFINPCLKLGSRPLKILDICYGIGYNTKCALRTFKNIELIDCVEIDSKLVSMSTDFEFDEKINKIIKNNLAKPDFINFYIDDIRKVIKKLDKKYDIIFHDGFAPHKQSELWSENLILEISQHLFKSAIYVTYNHSKPVLNALYKSGLILGKVINDNRTIATIASFDKNLIDNPLNEYELGELNTKSAITYKDFTLSSTHEKIVENRNSEVEFSNLMSLSSYKKRLRML